MGIHDRRHPIFCVYTTDFTLDGVLCQSVATKGDRQKVIPSSVEIDENVAFDNAAVQVLHLLHSM